MSRPEVRATSPWVEPAGHGASMARQRALRRAVERLSVLLLIATLGVAVAGSVPTLGRLLGDPVAPAARRGIARALRSRGFAVAAPEAEGHRRIRGGALDPGSQPIVPRLQYEMPTIGEPHEEGAQALFELMRQLERAAPAGTQALAVEPMALLDRADDHAVPVLRLQPGAMLEVERSFGDWLQLSTQVGDEVVYGWARRSRVLLVR